MNSWLVHEIRLQAALDYLEAHRWECLQCIRSHLMIVLELSWGVGLVLWAESWPGLEVGMRKGSQAQLIARCLEELLEAKGITKDLAKH